MMRIITLPSSFRAEQGSLDFVHKTASADKVYDRVSAAHIRDAYEGVP